MDYLLFYDYCPDILERRDPFRARHLEHAWKAQAEGRLVLAGALASPVDAAVFHFRCASADEVAAFAKEDPYVTAGLVVDWRVREWATVVGAEAATPLGRPAPATGFDDLDLGELRRRRGAKWAKCPPDAIAAWVADMDFPVAEPIRRALHQMTEASDLGYPPAPTAAGLATIFASRMRERFGWTVDPGDVEILTDVVQGLHLSVGLYSRPGDAVVTPSPIYPPFLQAVFDNGRRPVWMRYELTADGYRIDFERLRRELVPDARVMLVCNPHNPTGRVLTRAELDELAAIAIERDMVVISDEIHADLAYGGHRHVPIATLSPEIARRTVTLTSASKAFNIAGLRCAVAAFGSPELKRRFRSVHHHARGGLGAPGLAATAAAWTQGDPWLDRAVRYLEGNRDLVVEHVRSRWPRVRMGVPEATYLLWLDFGALDLPATPDEFFLAKARVMLSVGREFGEGFAACTRLNFATSRGILREVLGRMDAALR